MSLFGSIGKIFSSVVKPVTDFISPVSSIITGGLSYLGGQQSNVASAKQAQEQMDFQRSMSNTAHQREVQDLLAAGLNPILSAGGNGASTPGGAQALQSDVITPAINTALTAYKNRQEVENLKATNQNLRDMNEQIRSQTVLNDNNSALAAANARKANYEGDISKVESDIANTGAGYLGRTLGALSPLFNSASGVSNVVKNLKSTSKVPFPPPATRFK